VPSNNSDNSESDEEKEESDDEEELQQKPHLAPSDTMLSADWEVLCDALGGDSVDLIEV